MKQKICVHPNEVRYSAQSVEVNIIQTLGNAEMSIPFPMKNNPETFRLLLIY